jgi:predicted metal-dependent HD superfamily phosphohydrolase
MSSRIKNLATLNRWRMLWTRAGSVKYMDLKYKQLVARYLEKDRSYHTLSHISQCLGEFDSVRKLFKDPVCAEIAIWFHDAVYRIERNDNELRSAELAREVARKAGINEERAGKVYALVLATKHNKVPSDGDEMLVADIDLSIFGKPARTFNSYESAIRKEYSRVPQDEFSRGRANILSFFISNSKRSRIFLTEIFRDKYEKQARRNLLKSLSQLSKSE